MHNIFTDPVCVFLMATGAATIIIGTIRNIKEKRAAAKAKERTSSVTAYAAGDFLFLIATQGSEGAIGIHGKAEK